MGAPFHLPEHSGLNDMIFFQQFFNVGSLNLLQQLFDNHFLLEAQVHLRPVSYTHLDVYKRQLYDADKEYLEELIP